MPPFTRLPSVALVVAIFALAAVRATPLATTPHASSYKGPCKRPSYPIPNGDFQSGKLAPWKFHHERAQARNVTAEIVRTNESVDGYTLQLATTGEYAQAAVTLDGGPNALCAATLYALYFQYRAVGKVPDCTAIVTISANAGSGINESYIYFRGTDDHYHPTKLTFSTNYATTFSILVYITCAPAPPPDNKVQFYVDSFELAAIRSLEPTGCPNADIHVLNGDFESGNLSPWTVNSVKGNGTSVKVVRRGDGYAFRAGFNLPVYPEGPFGFNISNVARELCPAYVYVVSFNYLWVPGDEAKLVPAGLDVVLEDCLSVTLYPTIGWQRARLTCEAKYGGHKKLRVGVTFYPGRLDVIADSTLTLDNFAIKLAK